MELKEIIDSAESTELVKTASRLKTEAERLKKEVREKTATYITAGLGLVVGLAWNDAIKALIEFAFPATVANGIIAKFGYAAILTLIVVLLSTYLFRITTEKK